MTVFACPTPPMERFCPPEGDSGGHGARGGALERQLQEKEQPGERALKLGTDE
jgi:hypothetical protein